MESLDLLSVSAIDRGWGVAPIEIAWKGALAVALAGLLCALMRRGASAAERHAIWCAALIGLLALPLLQALLPAWSLPLLPAPGAAPQPAEFPAASPAATGTVRPAAAPAAGPALPELAAIWAAGCLLAFARLAVGFVRVRRLARQAEPVTDPSWIALLESLRRETGVTAPVSLLRLGAEITPLVWGVFRPAVLLPASADSWPAERRRAVLLHELAHIARRDPLTQVLAGVACALHWFNPLAWLAARRQRIESEHACDDRVLTSGFRASDYAGHLLAIARGLRGIPRTGAAALAMARPPLIESRLLAILAPGLRRRPARFGYPAVLVVAGALLPLAAAQPARPVAPPPDQGAPDDGYTYFWTHEDGSRYMLRTRGEIEYAPDDTDVRRLGADGYLLLEQSKGSSVRRLEVRRGAGGSIDRFWTVNGLSRPFDRDAAAFLSQALASFRRPRAGQEDEGRALAQHRAALCRQEVAADRGANGCEPGECPEQEAKLRECLSRSGASEPSIESLVEEELQRSRPPRERKEGGPRHRVGRHRPTAWTARSRSISSSSSSSWTKPISGKSEGVKPATPSERPRAISSRSLARRPAARFSTVVRRWHSVP